jgi:6-pyruvoyltetrahydropterin/6-carboxytetrahydropterin synthase
VNPFLPADEPGYNSFASKPAGQGLSIFFELGIELDGEVEPSTGLIVNVSDIDEKVRAFAVPVFADRIRERFRAASHIGYCELAEILKTSWEKLAGKFGQASLSKMCLKINPFKAVAIERPEVDMIYFSEKFEFAAAHKLWNEQFSEKQNIEVFGRCANPAGHGHNYIVEVTVKFPVDKELRTGDFEKVANQELIKAVDHKNLNEDLPEFLNQRPTVENIAVFAWNKLAGKFNSATLHCVTIWETDKTYSSYYG